MSTEDSTAERPTKRRATSSPEVDVKSQISTLETQITKSRRHLNNLTALLELARSREVQSETSNQAVIGLCRVFCRLMVQGSLTRSSKALEQEVIVFQWLQERYHEYVSLLIEHDLIDEDKSRTAVTLLMQLVKQEATYLDENQTWRTGTFFKIMQALMCTDSGAMARSELMSKFVKKYDDIRFYTFSALKYGRPPLTEFGADFYRQRHHESQGFKVASGKCYLISCSDRRYSKIAAAGSKFLYQHTVEAESQFTCPTKPQEKSSSCLANRAQK